MIIRNYNFILRKKNSFEQSFFSVGLYPRCTSGFPCKMIPYSWTVMLPLLVLAFPSYTRGLRVSEVFNFRTFNFSIPDPVANQISQDSAATTSAASLAAAVIVTTPSLATVASTLPSDLPEPYSEKGLGLDLVAQPQPEGGTGFSHTPPHSSSSSVQPQPQSQVDVFSSKPSG